MQLTSHSGRINVSQANPPWCELKSLNPKYRDIVAPKALGVTKTQGEALFVPSGHLVVAQLTDALSDCDGVLHLVAGVPQVCALYRHVRSALHSAVQGMNLRNTLSQLTGAFTVH